MAVVGRHCTQSRGEGSGNRTKKHHVPPHCPIQMYLYNGHKVSQKTLGHNVLIEIKE